MHRRAWLGSLVGLLAALVAMVMPAGSAVAQDTGAIAGVVASIDGPVSEAQVVLRNADGEVARTVSGPDGRFGFRAVPQGRYDVVAFKRGVGEGSVRVGVVAGEVTRVRVPLIAPVGHVAGLVYAGDRTVGGATVVLMRDGQVITRGQTDRRGGFGFRNIAPGMYTVVASKDGVGEGRAELTVRVGEISRVRVSLRQAPPPVGGVSGVVFTDTGATADANVALLRDGVVVAQTTSGRDGRFTFTGLREGTYTVRATKRGVGRGEAQATVVAGEVAAVRVRLSL